MEKEENQNPQSETNIKNKEDKNKTSDNKNLKPED